MSRALKLSSASGVANYGLRAKSGPPSIMSIKLYWNTSHSLAYVLAIAALELQRQTGYDRDHMACKVENMYFLAL